MVSMEPRDTIHRLAARRNRTRSDVLRTFREHGLSRSQLHNYWHGVRVPSPQGAAILCVALDLDARECLELYEACGIPTPDPVWEAVYGVAL
jgi:hypothetical protein